MTLRRLHPIAGMLAFLTILVFWTSTVYALFSSQEIMAAVKIAIPWGLFILIPCMALTAMSGFKISHGRTEPLVLAKKHRMPFIAFNGLCILAPCAIYLGVLAARGDFGQTFTILKWLDLTAGTINLSLMSLNIRDGFTVARKQIA